MTLPGAGVPVATDDVGGIQYQRVKADIGGDGSTVPVIAGQRTSALSISTVLSSDHPTVIVSNAQQVDTLQIGTTTYTVQRAPISCGASGDNSIVGATSGKQILVISLALIASAAVSIYFKSTSGACFGGATFPAAIAQNGGFVLEGGAHGWFKTLGANEALILNLSGAVGVAGCISYILV